MGGLPGHRSIPPNERKKALVPGERVLSRKKLCKIWLNVKKKNHQHLQNANTIPTHLHFQMRYCQHSTYASSCFLKSLIESHNLYRLPTNETKNKQNYLSVLACTQTLLSFLKIDEHASEASAGEQARSARTRSITPPCSSGRYIQRSFYFHTSARRSLKRK